jgi:nitrite reductase/ring-hydroxylating ferredoxin subunit
MTQHESDCRDCAGCPVADRRAFVRDALRRAAAALLVVGIAPGVAGAMPVRFAGPVWRRRSMLTYPVPAADGATIDTDNQVILVRHANAVYAFNLACPHQNTALKWLDDEQRFQCPKHKSRYEPDGTFISGRATRGMDRFAIKRDGANVAVDLDVLYRQDDDRAAWDAAVVHL